MTQLPWPADAPLFASGTDALAALLRWRAARWGWRRVWLPSYYCPEVPAAIRAHLGDITLLAYPDHDLWAAPEPASAAIAAGDIVVVANQLGLRPRPSVDRIRDAGAAVVEDHSHDLGSDWARDSAADYAFASLRKTLPLPDGGVVWSPRGLDLPPEPSAGASAAAGRLASAIADRRRPTGTAESERLRHRALARTAAGGPPPGVGAPGSPGSPERHGISPVSRALLSQMPLAAWRERRRSNIAILTEALGTPARARILVSPEGGVAFALTLLFDTPDAREQARRALVERAVVPAVLWPLEPGRDPGAAEADADLSRRILSVHADQRFEADDMVALGAILREALGSS